MKKGEEEKEERRRKREEEEEKGNGVRGEAPAKFLKMRF